MAASTVGSAARPEPVTKTSAPRPTARRNNRTSLYHPPASAQGNGVPEVYWSEGATPSGYSRADEGDSYTFYREPTPEPHEKRRTGVGIGALGDDERGFDGRAGRDRRSKRTCGMKAWVFWGVIALVLIVLIGVGVGVGVGVGMSSKGASAAASEEEPRSSTTPSTTATATSTETLTAESVPTASPTATGSESSTAASSSADAPFPTTTSPGSLTCPESNYTLYGVPGSDIRFLRTCGVDYPSQDGAVDIRTLWTESMAECMRNCAGTPGCTGSGWGPAEGACWLKKSLRSQGRADKADWEFALLQ